MLWFESFFSLLERGPTVKIFEVGQLDAFAHPEHVGRAAEAIEQHPHVPGVQSGDTSVGLGAGVPAEALHRVLDICPGGDDGAENHEAEGEEGHSRNGAAEPEDFAVGDQDDGQVLEDGVDGNGEELKGFGTGVDHAD